MTTEDIEAFEQNSKKSKKVSTKGAKLNYKPAPSESKPKKEPKSKEPKVKEAKPQKAPKVKQSKVKQPREDKLTFADRMELFKLRFSRENREPKPKKKPVDILLNVILCIFVIAFLVVVGVLLNYQRGISVAQKTVGTIRDFVLDVNIEEEKKLRFVNIDGVLVWDKYAEAYMHNKDLVGWITIDNTVIDYPVMQTPNSNDFYLYKDFNKNYSAAGSIFADENSNIETLSDNVLLYGHHMKAGTMFASLDKYEDKQYFKDHKFIQFDTINGSQTYEVVAAFRTTIDADFKYYEFFEAESDSDYQSYVDNVLKASSIDGKIDGRQKLLTLSTCAYHSKNGRFVVVAKQVTNTDDYEKEVVTLYDFQQERKAK